MLFTALSFAAWPLQCAVLISEQDQGVLDGADFVIDMGGRELDKIPTPRDQHTGWRVDFQYFNNFWKDEANKAEFFFNDESFDVLEGHAIYGGDVMGWSSYFIDGFVAQHAGRDGHVYKCYNAVHYENGFAQK